VGSDADVVLWDTSVERVITKTALHDDLDYTPYEGMQVRGAVVRTLLRGSTVYQRGTPDVVSARRGQGRWVACGKPDLLGWTGEWPATDDVVQRQAVALLGPALDGARPGTSTSSEDSSRKRVRTE